VTGDVLIEAPGGGIDTVSSSIAYVLGADLENLTLTGLAAIDGTGNNLDNLLMGNVAANTLAGGIGNDSLDGGLGADVLIGGTGNDAYWVDTTLDLVTENPGEGLDTITSTVTWSLGADVENLTLGGVAVINGTGNAAANTLTGNTAANQLYGLGGDDALDGGSGNDLLDGGAG